MNKKNLIGQKFGRLTVLSDSGLRAVDGTIKWKCKCECGNYTCVNTTNLTRGVTQSCGCLQKERTTEAIKRYNSFTFKDDTCIGVDNKGLQFIIDAEDYSKIKDICWIVDKKDGHVTGVVNGRNLRLHRYVLNIDDPNMMVDHINHNPSDNRKSNLRLVNKSQNGMNRPAPQNNKSGYKGVCQISNGKYMARIMINYKGIYLGCYDTPEEASIAYESAAKKYFGEYAYKGGEINE